MRKSGDGGERGGRIQLMSAKTGEGLEELLGKISDILMDSHKLYRVTLGPSERGLLSWLYENGHVQGTENLDDGGVICSVTMAPDVAARFQGRHEGDAS